LDLDRPLLIKDKLKCIINEDSDEDMSKGNQVRSNKDIIRDPRKKNPAKLNLFSKKDPFAVTVGIANLPDNDHFDQELLN
jgi:hypothetical protein